MQIKIGCYFSLHLINIPAFGKEVLSFTVDGNWNHVGGQIWQKLGTLSVQTLWPNNFISKVYPIKPQIFKDYGC